MTDTTWHDVGHVDSFQDGEVVAAIAGGHKVAVFRLGEDIFALKDLCSHGNARLSDGYIEDGCVECPLHQGLIDIRTGAPCSAPVTEPVRCYPVRISGEQVEVDVSDAGQAQEAIVTHTTVIVSRMTRAAPDVMIVHLQCETPVPYQSGQYIDVILEQGERRSYSMASPAGSAEMEWHIRHVPGGMFTDQVFGQLQPGTALQVEGPGGSFYLREGDAPAILLASGTGFAPIRAIIEEQIQSGSQRQMHLYWGGRQLADLYLHALCLQWAQDHPWFRYTPVLSDAPASSWEGRRGFVHQVVMADHPDMRAYEVYACGAPVVVESARRDFTGACGLSAGQFFADAFLTKGDRK